MTPTFKNTGFAALLAGAIFVAHGAPRYRVIDDIKIEGDARWDYLTVDAAAHRLYVSHDTRTEVIDTLTDKVVGAIQNTSGVHGIAIAAELGRGYTSNGKADTVTVFDLGSLATVATVAVGGNPDAIVYEPRTRRVFTFNGRSRDISVIDATNNRVLDTVALAAKPEFAQVDVNGDVFFNLESSNELAVLDPASLVVTHRYPLAPCEAPTGLAVDGERRFFSVCGNKLMVVSRFDGRRVAQAPIGSGADGVAWLDGAAYSANGADGTVTRVQLGADGEPVLASSVVTALGARTIAADPSVHRLYLPTAVMQPRVGAARPSGVPGTFHVLVLGTP